MDLKDYKTELASVNKEILALSHSDQKIIGDGPIDSSTYLISKIKILWLLKEAYDNENDGKGGWSMAELLCKNDVYQEFFFKNKK
jgi:hypothetical protein